MVYIVQATKCHVVAHAVRRRLLIAKALLSYADRIEFMVDVNRFFVSTLVKLESLRQKCIYCNSLNTPVNP